MAQIRRTMWLPSFLTCYVERMLQKWAREGYQLVSAESEMGLYTFLFEETAPQTARFYVYKQDDLKKSGAYGVSPTYVAKEEMGPYCAEMIECSGYSFVGRLREDVPNDVLRDAVAKRMRNTAKYHLQLLAFWLLMPLVCWLVVTIARLPWQWGNVTVGIPLMGSIYLYHLVAAAVSFFEARTLK